MFLIFGQELNGFKPVLACFALITGLGKEGICRVYALLPTMVGTLLLHHPGYTPPPLPASSTQCPPPGPCGRLTALTHHVTETTVTDTGVTVTARGVTITARGFCSQTLISGMSRTSNPLGYTLWYTPLLVTPVRPTTVGHTCSSHHCPSHHCWSHLCTHVTVGLKAQRGPLCAESSTSLKPGNNSPTRE